jgi:transposase-like protein
MRESTSKRKKATKYLARTQEEKWWADKMMDVMVGGKQALDAMFLELGRLTAETIMYIEREEKTGRDYAPTTPGVYKWASQGGSIYIGDQKIKVERPRMRGPDGEIKLETYARMKERNGFSEELLAQVLRGMSCRNYEDTVLEVGKSFGVSPSAVSQHIIEATTKQLTEFKERSLAGFEAFSIFLDTVHRGGQAFVVALGINIEGTKSPLGFWEGATENHEICRELFEDMERRGLKLSNRVVWVTDGGGGIIKALKERFGKKLIHQRCIIHKDRNIQCHLPKKYRKQAHVQFTTALEQNTYEDARKMLLDFEKWLRNINESAADSLLEAIEEILTLHKLKVPAILRKTLHSTNPIESMFSMVRHCERNIKRYRDSKMRQRWLAAVLLHCEKQFRRIKGFAEIDAVLASIDAFLQ